MSRICEICNKRTTTGNNVSHSKRRTKRTWKANLKTIKLEGKKTTLCSRCHKGLMSSPRTKDK